MRKLFTFIILLNLMLITSLANAEWTQLDKIEAPIRIVYIDLERVNERNNNYMVWFLINNVEKKSSIILLTELNCRLLAVKTIQASDYTQLWGKGPKEKETAKGRWTYAQPNSTGEKRIKMACKKIS